MISNEDKLLKVASYLEGDMEPEEQIGFEQMLAADEELQKLVADYRDLHQTLKMHLAPSQSDLEVNEKLRNLNDQYFKSRKTARIIPFVQYLKWGSAAAVLIIGLFVWAPWNADLYEKYAVKKEMSVAERGDGNDNELQKAAEFYNQKNFTAAVTLLKKEYQKDSGNALVAYYYGLTLTEINKPGEAIPVLEKLYAGESVFKYDAAYGIALSHLKQGNTLSAITWLSKVPESNGNYAKAQELIQKLK